MRLSIFRIAAVVAAATAALAASPARAQQPADSTTAQLARIAQALMDAVATGDTATWNRWLAADGVFTDENGRTRTKAEVVGELGPLPPGYVGHIRVTNPRAAVAGETETAVLSYDAMEDLTLYGQRLDTHFHSTDTFIRRAGEWRMIGQQVQVLPGELRPVTVDPSTFDALVGTYELGTGVTIEVRREGGRLMAQRSGRPADDSKWIHEDADLRVPTQAWVHRARYLGPKGRRPAEELLPIGGDRFVRRGAPRGERFFTRDAAGRVTAMVDRRDNLDLVWRRVAR